MIDTRAVAQEVQDQLNAAFQKGQEQIRKGRESVTVAVRAGSQIAQAVKPSLPKLPSVQVKVPSLSDLASPDKLRASAHELASQMLAAQRKLTDQALTTQRKLAGQAQELTDHALTRQRKLGDRALEVAGTLISDGVSGLAQAAGTFAPGRRAERGNHSQPADHTSIATPAEAAAKATATGSEDAPGPKQTRPAKASTAKASPAKSTTAKASPKPRTTKTAGTTKAAGTTNAAGPTKTKTGTAKTAPPRPAPPRPAPPRLMLRRLARPRPAPPSQAPARPGPRARRRSDAVAAGWPWHYRGDPAAGSRRLVSSRLRPSGGDSMNEPWDSQMKTLGAFIRRQRQQANLSLRQLADRTKLSNPYLSQIERGLHQPSVRVIRLISDALNVSTETLLAQAGLLHHKEASREDGAQEPTVSVEEAIQAESRLTDEQKRALIAVLRSMLPAE